MVKFVKVRFWQEMDHLDSATGKRLKLLAEALDIKGARMPALTDGVIPESRWSEYVRGKRLITIEAALALRAIYGVTLDYIYAGDMSGLPHHIVAKLRKAA